MRRTRCGDTQLERMMSIDCNVNKRLVAVALGAASVAALLVVSAEPSQANPGQNVPCGAACQSVTGGVDQATLGLINEQRARDGCGRLASNAQLAAAAQLHARDMLNDAAATHVGSDGTTPDQRIADAGYTPIGRWGEIQYAASGGGFTTPQAAVDGWMNSPAHRSIIMDCSLVDVGFATASNASTTTYVGDFAAH
jgi:uncharacterized protein YkwD